MTKKQNVQTKEKIYDLKNDVIFQTFFSRKGNEEFLIDFLKALLKIEITEIEMREEVNLEKLARNEKGGRLDLQAKLNDGVIVNIEMQIENTNNIENRTLAYGAKTISREVKRGTDYKEIKQVIMINILNYEMLGFDEYISETVTVLDKHREYEIIKGIKWYFIELPKFRRTHPDMNEKLNQWLVFIDNYDRGLVKMAEKKNKTLEKARAEMNYLTGDEEVRRLAELREKWEMDYVDAQSHGRQLGLEEGIQEGRQEGLRKGREEGIKKGREEARKEKIEMVRKMKKNNLSIELIEEITGLKKEEIDSIK